GARAASRDLDEEVEQHGLATRRRDEHVPAAAQAGQAGLGGEGDARGADRRVHRVAARREHVGPGLRGTRISGGDDAAHQALLATGNELRDVELVDAERATPLARALALGADGLA